MVRKVVSPATISVRTVVLFSPSLKIRSSIVISPETLRGVCGFTRGFTLCKTSWLKISRARLVCLWKARSLQSAAIPRSPPEDRSRMRMSQYFLPTMKENPSEAQIVSHRLMLRAGLVRQTSAGIYAWLPLGLRVLRNIERIVREEQDASGAQEVLMPTIQSADLWRESGRYDAYGPEMLRIKDRNDHEMLYGPTNEEMITVLFRDGVKSYRDLPRNLYHIQWKFRDERRPRFGVMRGREFLMKDAYSFDIDEAAARRSYNRMFLAYLNIYARLGLKAIPVKADPGPIGGDLSHEFIILADTGESEVFAHGDLVEMGAPGPDIDWDGDLEPMVAQRSRLYAASDEMHDPSRFEAEVPAD